MSRYQTHIRIATSHRLFRIGSSLLLTALFLLWPCVQPAAALAFSTPQTPARYSPTRQNEEPGTGLLYLLPIEATAVEMKTHTAEFTLQYDPALGLSADVRMLYRLHNPTQSTENLLIRITPTAAQRRLSAYARNVILTVDGAFQELQAAENGTFSTLTPIAKDSQRDLFLTYSISLDEHLLPLLRYRAAELTEWGGTSSWRVTIAIDDSIVPESWLGITPDGWKYDTVNRERENTIKWLYEAELTNDPLTFHFIHPRIYQSLEQSRRLATNDRTVAAYSLLAEQLRQLYDASLSEGAEEVIVERFYLQTLAAVASGLEATANAGAFERAELQMALASLYRSRILPPTGGPELQYAQLTVDAAGQALSAIPAGDPRHPELMQWQTEGLSLLLNDALERNDLQTAFSLIEALEALPESAQQAEAMGEARRVVTLRQALLLLEQGERQAAISLAGPEIVDNAYLPPNSSLSLFSGWLVTTTVTADVVDLDFRVQAAAESFLRARTALEQQTAVWNAAQLDGLQASVHGVEGERIRLQVRFPLSAGGGEAAALVSPGLDWVFLRTLLQQLTPRTERETRAIWQRVSLQQSLDLRPAADQWAAMAATLEQQADRIEAQAPTSSALGVDAAGEQLRARIEAIHYRNAAGRWLNLVENSGLLLRMELPGAIGGRERTWSMALTSPSQTFTLQSERISVSRLTIVLAGFLFGLMALSAILWRLV